MPGPLFFLQIVDVNGVVARHPGGGGLETDLIELVTRHIMTKGPGILERMTQQIIVKEPDLREQMTSHILAKGVGFLRTEAHVEQDVRDALAEVPLEQSVRTGLAAVSFDQDIRDGIAEAIMAMKDQTKWIV